ncbi:glycerophosphodiester phosphodiesterase [Saccharibacillus alkalitolerans]|uniref:Glycerophosphodiester phosphodiesterase n=1 Tax=Saccharibacillus alkalitolerans TaxID=2705290 RepID=A0ABX0F2Z7_9BACL|nr:glycerophosphodiester phosphodiesterase [Saccharibacillus alkalitolerans]NGZ75368.1 glycerophosphodiester phosphodiesterase [Saccharibacillus alkalitolerans]
MNESIRGIAALQAEKRQAAGRPGAPIIFAHRGASGTRPENTMAAFRRAVELGAAGIETDVQLSADGEPVLIHDETLTRTAGAPGWVGDKTYEEIRGLDAGSWYHPEFMGERIPHLDELLQLSKETGIVVNIELKNTLRAYEGIEEKVIAAVRAHGLERQTVISSFNHYSLALCKRLAPEIRTGILYMEGLYRPWDYAKSIGADALHAYDPAVRAEWVREALEAGVDYHPFTVNDETRMRELIGMGTAGIITDYPDRAARLLAERDESRTP